LLEGLALPAATATELLGLRAHRLYLQRTGRSGRLRCDDLTSDEILDDAVDGLQFEYLLADGCMVDLRLILGRFAVSAYRCWYATCAATVISWTRQSTGSATGVTAPTETTSGASWSAR